MKLRIPMMVDDARFAPIGRPEAVENVDFDKEDGLGDGPSCERLVVEDLDGHTNRLMPGAVLLPPQKGRRIGHYLIPDGPSTASRAFNQVSVFATALKTIYMFEEPDTLGRRVRWGFDAPRLRVIPRAGYGENAFYCRETSSIDFLYFRSHHNPHDVIYTSLARDIVAHETGHAILDGIVPHLLDAVTPQSLALHEAIADLCALLVSIRSTKLRKAVLRKTGGAIDRSTHFSAIAEEYGLARGSGALRDLKNDLRLCDVNPSRHYALSQVLTGALYAVFIKMFAQRRRESAVRRSQSEYSVSGYALYTATEHFKRMTLRALDYLPPGEASFADYGRAIIAADQASHPDDAQEREWIADEFIQRGIIAERSALVADQATRNYATDVLQNAEPDLLFVNDELARRFAGSSVGRAMLGIPANAEFWVEPSLSTSKVSYHRSQDDSLHTSCTREYLLKVWWKEEESSQLPHAPRRWISVGTTVVWDRDVRKVSILLTSNHQTRSREHDLQRRDRDLFQKQWLERNALCPDAFVRLVRAS